MRDIFKNIFYKSTRGNEEEDTDEELLLFKMNITGNTPEEKRNDGPSLEGKNLPSLPASLKESVFPSSSTSGSSSQPIYYSREKSNEQKKEKARKEVYSQLITHVTKYIKDDGRKINKNKKTVLFKEGNFEAYIYPQEEDHVFGYRYHHVELIPSDKTYFTPHMTRNFNIYVERETELTPEQSLKLFENHLENATKR